MTLKEHLLSSPFTLALSSGYFGFFAHAGFARALHEAGIRPARLAGASAGAIIAASLAHGIEISEIETMLRRLKKSDFWDPGLGFGLLKGLKFEALVQESLSGKSLAIPFSASVFDILSRKTKRFSAGDEVEPARLVRASSAVPVMFHPVRIGSRFYWDGGILDKMGVHGLRQEERVFVHYLPGRDAHSSYERRRDISTLNENRSALMSKMLPAVGPNFLDRGLRAMDVAYENTVRALKLEHAPFLTL